MRRIRVKLTGRRDDSYDIVVKSGLADEFASFLPKASVYAIISDSKVAALYGDKITSYFRKNNLKYQLVTFPAGEKSKTRETKARIEDKLFSCNLDRNGCIIAVGGGVTGDLAGFVAATYMRGVSFVQMPTTLLAMVDASVGGKVAVDAPGGKNLVGAFYQPKAVLIDPLFLKTLPKSQVRAGIAEIVKHAVIADKKLFETLEKDAGKLIKADPAALEPIIAANCAIKARVVSRDEREGNLRQILNYGHTIGHAVEKLMKYKISHGDAVAIGMAVGGLIAKEIGVFSEKDYAKQNSLLEKFGFKLKLPKGATPESILKAMKSDKKARAGNIRMAAPERIGKMYRAENGDWVMVPPDKIVRAAIDSFKQ